MVDSRRRRRSEQEEIVGITKAQRVRHSTCNGRVEPAPIGGLNNFMEI
jgi:hypothetical protein